MPDVIYPCEICGEPTERQDILMCPACRHSYDRWHRSSADQGDVLSAMTWAAHRARRFERKRARRKTR